MRASRMKASHWMRRAISFALEGPPSPTQIDYLVSLGEDPYHAQFYSQSEIAELASRELRKCQRRARRRAAC